MKHVITIHGIKKAGEWQQRLDPLLAPHFKCFNLKYEEYRYLGALKLIVDPLVLAVGVASVVLLNWVALKVFHVSVAASAVPSIVAFLAICGLARHRATSGRNQLLYRIKAQIDDQIPIGETPHVIAHSFGTYLLGCLLERYQELRFEAVVLTGCVLRTDFPWADKISTSESNHTATRVRNEVAQRDWVVRLAPSIRWFVPDIGNAGWDGFHGNPKVIHTIKAGKHCDADCNGCAGVHNIVHERFSHSECFVGTRQAEYSWMPFLWNINLREFRDFVDGCRVATEILSVSECDPRLSLFESFFSNTKFQWARGKTVRDLLKAHITGALDEQGVTHSTALVNDLTDSAMPLLWRLVHQATDATVSVKRGDTTPQMSQRATALNPQIAVAQTADTVVRQYKVETLAVRTKRRRSRGEHGG